LLYLSFKPFIFPFCHLQVAELVDLRRGEEKGVADVPLTVPETLSFLPQPSSAMGSTILNSFPIPPASQAYGTALVTPSASASASASAVTGSPPGEGSPGGGTIEAQRKGVSDIDLSGVPVKMSPLFPRSSPQLYPSTSARNATDVLLAEFLAAAPVGDEKMTLTVKKGLHEVLLLEFGSESMVLESLRILLSRGDYLR
jgi:hypothetical protein